MATKTKKTRTTTRKVASTRVKASPRKIASRKVSSTRKPVSSTRKVATTRKPVKKQVVKRLVVPHRENDYRPLIARRYGIVVVLALIFVTQIAYNFVTDGRFGVLGRESNITISELVQQTNEQRLTAGAGTLTVNETLSKAAFMKAQDMFSNDYWAHNSPTGVTPWKWLADVDYAYDVAGENLAKNFPNAATTVKAWMDSESHRKNMLDGRYKEVGFAVVDGTLEGKQTTLVVAYYGLPADNSKVASASDSQQFYVAPVNSGVGNPLAYFGSALQSLSPATIGALALLTLVGLVSLIAHHNRKRLPRVLQKNWQKHKEIYKIVGLVAVGFVIILGTGGGQI